MSGPIPDVESPANDRALSPHCEGRTEVRLAKKWLSRLRWSLGCLGLFLGTRFLFGSAYRVPSPSMVPALAVGDLVFAESFTVGGPIPGVSWSRPRLRALQPTDVVLFRVPFDVATVYIKRVVGLPGDTIGMRHGVFLRNGRRDPVLSRDSLFVDRASDPADFVWHEPFRLATGADQATRPPVPTAREWGPLVVPPAHVFVLGDNRGASRDSRHFGFIPDSLILSRATVVYWRNGRPSLHRPL